MKCTFFFRTASLITLISKSEVKIFPAKCFDFFERQLMQIKQNASGEEKNPDKSEDRDAQQNYLWYKQTPSPGVWIQKTCVGSRSNGTE